MSVDQMRQELEAFRTEVAEAHRRRQDPRTVIEHLDAVYRAFSERERALADQVIVGWVVAEDQNLRFDAQHLVDEFKIAAAVPALHDLARELAVSRAPGAPYELQKVRRILAEFAAVR